MTNAHIRKLFAYKHLPEHLQKVSKPIHDMALSTAHDLSPSPERTIALRKLWEFKNLVVWCAANE